MIYVVEDDSNIRELLLYTLQNSGLEACGFGQAADFWQAMGQRLPQLVLLDRMLPGEDGLSVLGKLRGAPATRWIPVILVTARDSEYDKVLGLDSGADDYITKPFGMMELLARVKALLRRTRPETAEEYRLGELYVCPDKHLVRVEEQEVTLTHKEFELLCLLLRNPSMVFTRDKLLDLIWGYAFDGESRTVDVHIRNLRQKLGPAGRYIETVRGVGYRIGGAAGEG